MAEGILGLGSSGAASLNQELIDKLKSAERKATVEPIENDLEDMVSERASYGEITTKVNELLATIRPFDLYVTSGSNVFDQKSALASGDSVTFDAPDVSKLNAGITTVNVTQLAQKDVYQSDIITTAQKDTLPAGDLNIKVGDTTHTFSMSDYDSYDKLVEAIDNTIGVNASFDQVGVSGGEPTYRLILKSDESGLENSLEISGSAASSLGIGDEYSEFDYSKTISGMSSDTFASQNIDINGNNYSFTSYDDLLTQIQATDASLNVSITNGIGDFTFNIENVDKKNQVSISDAGFAENETKFLEGSHVLQAQNMEAVVDGIDYSVSSNFLEVDGLKMTATQLGESSININKDNSQTEPLMQEFVTKYNEVIGILNNEIASTESALSDKSSLRNIVDQVKDKLFGSYGKDGESIFNYGFELNKSGILTLDTGVFNDKLENDPEGLQNLLVGSAEAEGLGTQLKSVIDEMSYTGGVLTAYENSMNSREENLEEEKEKAQESLDNKYEQLSLQFGAYTGIITQFESSFSSLKLMIEQSVS